MLLLLLALTSAAQPLPAPSRDPQFAVFAAEVDPAAEPGCGRLELDLAAALKARGAKPADLDLLFPPPKEPTDEGDALIAAGKQAYDNLDFDEAISKLNEAGTFFVRHAAVADPQKLAEVFLFLGAAKRQNGDKSAGKDFSRAVVLAPDLAVDAKFFGAEVARAVASAKAEIAARPKGSLVVTALPSGGSAELLGKPLGQTPLPAVELAPGRYHVRVGRPGYVPQGAFPELHSEEKLDVKLTLPPLPTYSQQIDAARAFINRSAFDADTLPPLAAQLGAALQSRYLVLVRVASSSPTGPLNAEAQVWDLERRERLRGLTFSVTPDGVSQAAHGIKQWLDRPAPIAAVETKSKGPGTWVKQPLFWVAAGVVAAGIVTAAAVAAQKPARGFDLITGIP